MGLHFDAALMPKPKGEYVAWLDGMGTGSALASSLPTASNYVLKLHSAFAQKSMPEGVTLYPVMDGMYVASADREAIQTLLRNAFSVLAEEFVAHKKILRQFMVRAGIAYGATIHGRDVPDAAFTKPGEEIADPDYAARLQLTRKALLLSSAMVPAVKAEGKAAPFGVHVHDSALTSPQIVDAGDSGFPDRMWRWWMNGRETEEAPVKKLKKSIASYFDDARTHATSIGYPLDRQETHRTLFDEYFRDL